MSAEILVKFKSAKFETIAESEAFVLAAGTLDAGTLVKLLDILLVAKGGGQDVNVYKRRCGIFSTLAEGAKDPALFAHYVKALKSADAVLRQTLLALLPRVNNVSEHHRLCDLLGSSDAQGRTAIAQTLLALGGKAIFDTLKGYLKDKNYPARTEAIEVLARVGGHHAIGVLQELLAVGKPNEKMLAIRHLGDPRFLNSKERGAALQAIGSAMDDSNEQLALQAVQSFGNICSEDEWFDVLTRALDSPRALVAKAAVDGLRRFNSPRVHLVLERMLRAGPNLVRMAVLGVLETIGNDDVLGILVEALGHRQLVVRNKAGEILQRLGKAGKVELSRTIVYLLQSPDVNVRRMAVELAKTVKDPANALWPKLLAVLRDEDWWVRERIADVLVEMAGVELTRHVAGYLNDPSDVVRRYAVDVLRRIKDPQALGLLVRVATSDSDWWVREKCIEAAAAINDPRAIPYITDFLAKEADLRWVCLQALHDMDARGTAPEVAKHLADPQPETRLVALRCLQKFGSQDFAQAIGPMANDSDYAVRTLAKEVLHHWNMSVALQGVTMKELTSPLDQLLAALARQGGDDLIVSSGRQPAMKRHGRIVPLAKNVLTPEQVRGLLLPLLHPDQIASLDQLRDVDFSYAVRLEGLRFRVNVFHESNGLAAVFRIIKGTLLTMEQLGVPEIVRTFSRFKNGLVLVGGPTGSGKSTTLAALIDDINLNDDRHIISLEDPIEVVHLSKKSLVNQREIGTHTRNFHNALRATLREDPDVILVGELRDLPTIQFAVTAAETGHLVFGTVHTVAADTSVDRLINTFPVKAQEQVRSMLAESLRAVANQYLIKGRDGNSRHMAMEVMVNNDAISALIRKGKAFQIPSVIISARDQGMQTMDADLMRLFKEDKIAIEEAYVKARSKKDFEQYMPQGSVPTAQKPAGEGAKGS